MSLLACILLCLLFPQGEADKPAGGSQERPFPGETEITKSIFRGVKWLQDQQKPYGSYGTSNSSKEGRVFTHGPTALAVLALRSNGVNSSDPSVRDALKYLMKSVPTLTYDLGLTLMAMESKGAPTYERFDLEAMSARMRKSYSWPREFTKEEIEYMKACMDKLVAGARNGLWSYGDSEERPDLSNTQFAALGLAAAGRSGLAVPGKIWHDLLGTMIRYQVSSGPKTSLMRGQFVEAAFNRGLSQARARGWSYIPSDRNTDDVNGARVNIGISCILLAHEELYRRGSKGYLRRAKNLLPRIGPAVRDGVAWLVANWAVDRNPPQSDYLYYYLYSIERVGVLLNVDRFGKHDWYAEGARELLGRQLEGGSWPGDGWCFEIPSTSLALLFLSKATTPRVVTGAR